MDRGAWWATVHEVAKSRTRLSDFTFTLYIIFSLFHYMFLRKMDIGLNKAVYWASPVAQMVKRLPAMQETWVQSLGQEDPLEKEMTTAWRIPWTEESGESQSMGPQRVGHD